MPKMSTTDATIHATQDLIHSLQNSEPARPLFTLVNSHKESLRSLSEIFIKATSAAVPLRVPIQGTNPEKLQQVKQEENQIKNHSS